MKVTNLKIGQILIEGRYEVKVISISKTSFEAEYAGFAYWTYKEEDLNNGTLIIK